MEQPGILKIALPAETLDLARPQLEDLRLLDASGREVPFLIERPVPPTAAQRAPRSFTGTLTEGATQLLIETGTDAPLDAIVLTTPSHGFLKAARLDVSADGTQWENVSTGEPVFRQFGAEQLRLPLHRRSVRRVRVTLDDTRSAPVPFVSATLILTPPQAVPSEPVAAQLVRRDEFAGESELVIDLGAKHLPLATLEVATTEPLFARTVKVAVRELRDDVAAERSLATGNIYRVAVEGLPPAERLEVPLGFSSASRELLVHIAHGDSPPLPIDDFRIERRPIWLVFRATEPGPHVLLTGNPRATPPQYDLAALAAHFKNTLPTETALGAATANPNYTPSDTLAGTRLVGAAIDPASWSFRKPVRLAAAGVHELELDLDVLARARGSFADLRLVQEGTQVPYLLERPALARSLSLEIAAVDTPKEPRVSRWEIKLPRSSLPISRLTLTASTPLFQRHVRLLERVTDERGGVSTRVLTAADWSQTPGASQPLVLFLAYPPRGDTLLLETDNGDNPPLLLASVQATHPVVRLLFKTDPEPLALYYGNPAATAPRYDLALVAAHILAAEKTAATLGAEESSKSGRWAQALFDRGRAGPVFWVALAFVVVVLLATVARLIPKPPPV